MAFCSNCGNKLNDGAQFCPNCGQQVNEGPSTSEQPKGFVEAFKEGWKEADSKNDNKKEDENDWKYGCGLLIFIALVIGFFVNECSGDDSKDETNAPQTEQVVSDKQTETKESEEVQSEQKQESSFLGTYEITDMSGYKLTLNINEDETVTCSDEYTTYYGSWTGPTSVGVIINFSEKEPYLTFEGGKDKFVHPVFYLRDGWLYTGGNNASAKNPNWRLKVKKIK